MRVDTEIFDMEQRRGQGWPRAPYSVIVFGHDDGEKTVDFWEMVEAVDEKRRINESNLIGREGAESARRQHLMKKEVDKSLIPEKPENAKGPVAPIVTREQLERVQMAGLTVKGAAACLDVTLNAIYSACTRHDITLKRGSWVHKKKKRIKSLDKRE
jgi:hypothetical protein